MADRPVWARVGFLERGSPSVAQTAAWRSVLAISSSDGLMGGGHGRLRERTLDASQVESVSRVPDHGGMAEAMPGLGLVQDEQGVWRRLRQKFFWQLLGFKLV